VAIEAPEQMVVVNLYSAFVFFISGDSISCASDFVFEQIGQGDELDSGICIQVLA
jgi:hypothetical protein